MRWTLFILLLMSLGGCTSKGQQPAGDGAPLAGAWQPQPVAMRVYPATRFMQRRGQPLLEARVELFDAMNDSIKGSGTFRFELYDGQGASDEPQRLYTWDVEVLSFSAHQQHYDPITRTYVFPLRLDDLAVAQRKTLLRVVLSRDTGRRLEVEASIAPLP